MANLQSTSITGTLTLPTTVCSGATGYLWYNTSINKLQYSYASATAWSTGGALSTSRYSLAGAGTNTAALAFGGKTPSSPFVTNSTETYNGTSWSSGGALSTTRYFLAGAGASNTAALAFGGNTPGAACTETYNGTSWSAGGALIKGRQQLGGAGTNTSALAFGGYCPPSTLTCTEAYNGSSWSAGCAMITVRYGLAGAGTQAAALGFGGFCGGPLGNTESYSSSVLVCTL